MWYCPKCKAGVENVLRKCWACGTSPEGGEDPDFVPQAVTEPKHDSDYAVLWPDSIPPSNPASMLDPDFPRGLYRWTFRILMLLFLTPSFFGLIDIVAHERFRGEDVSQVIVPFLVGTLLALLIGSAVAWVFAMFLAYSYLLLRMILSIFFVPKKPESRPLKPVEDAAGLASSLRDRLEAARSLDSHVAPKLPPKPNAPNESGIAPEPGPLTSEESHDG